MMYAIIVTLLIATNGISRLQAAFAEQRDSLFDDSFPFGNSNDSFPNRRDSLFSSHNSESGDTRASVTGPINNFASHVRQERVVITSKYGRNVVMGAQDVHVGNTYFGNPNATNIYAPTVVQKNNTYQGKISNAIIGASVTQIGNVYPKNPGKNDTYGPTVIQEDNIYPENSGNNTVIGAIVNQINNTYPQSLEGNEDALNPIIRQHGNVNPSIHGTNSVVGAIVNRSGNNFHPSKVHDKGPGVGITESQAHLAEDSAFNGQASLATSRDDFSLDAENEEVASLSAASSGSRLQSLYTTAKLSNEKAENNAENQVDLAQHNSFNGQLSLSFNTFYFYSLIVLCQYYLF